MIQHVYKSKTKEELIQNTGKVFEEILNKKLRDMGSEYQIKFTLRRITD
ncbi:MAG: hypothetical protein FWG70_02555 [Oscillospiraceae bacterium]|nr:hypothetical protein [Oscillospiraceae bacterium]